MDQGGCLQRLAGFFLGQLVGRQLPQFIVDQRQKFLGGARVAFLDGRQDSSDLVHEAEDIRDEPGPQVAGFQDFRSLQRLRKS